MIAVTMRCPEPTCREACVLEGDPGLWTHEVDSSPACDTPERIEVEPSRARYTGRLWRLTEAREQMRRDVAAEASRIVAGMPPAVHHCGDCDAAVKLALTGALEAAWERALAFAQDEYARPHPVDRTPVTT